jgi:hypothetical protein
MGFVSHNLLKNLDKHVASIKLELAAQQKLEAVLEVAFFVVFKEVVQVLRVADFAQQLLQSLPGFHVKWLHHLGLFEFVR